MKQHNLRRRHYVLLSILFLTISGLAPAQSDHRSSEKRDVTKAHKMATPDEIIWGKPLASGKPGLELVVLDGDPMRAGAPFSLRLKIPDGLVVQPHWHPVDENVVVVQGTLLMGEGDKLLRENARSLPVGSYALMPQKTRHYFWARGETIIHVYGVGPFITNWVDPAR